MQKAGLDLEMNNNQVIPDLANGEAQDQAAKGS